MEKMDSKSKIGTVPPKLRELTLCSAGSMFSFTNQLEDAHSVLDGTIPS